jgi:1-acyl-sn-glycerol-3-phosphate acyltransferase
MFGVAVISRSTFLYPVKLSTVLLLGPVFFLAALLGRPFGKDIAIAIFEGYLRLIFRIFDIRLSFEFDEPNTRQSAGSVLVVLNQSSFLDSLACPLVPVRPTKGIMNFEYALYPIIGWLSTLVSFIVIRQWPRQAKRTLNRAGAFLRSGGNILISIEGRRSHDGTLSEYKKGPVVMAIENQAQIVPMIIYGSRACLPFGSLRVRPGSLRVRFLPPISTRGLSYADRNSLRETLRQVAFREGLA